MEVFLRKLSYFNLALCLAYLALAKLKGDWLGFLLLLFPLVFNWRVLQNLKIRQFKLGFWHDLTAILTSVYAVFSIVGILQTFVALGQQKTMWMLLTGEIVLSLTLLVHLALALKLDKPHRPAKN
ncbi:hypothetical protein [Pedobacter sp. ASV12]|uniref:hypothetical protein n=1 Tax=Pedobacter sp. ASV12 TaxID=2795120 RepID=UPI0018EB17F1|nr:hypothetical protein [Pedobacter sp. ASV12]